MDNILSTDLGFTPANSVAGGNLFETVLDSAQQQLLFSFSPAQELGITELTGTKGSANSLDQRLTLFPGLDLSEGLRGTPGSRFADEVNIFTPLRRSLPSSDALIGSSAKIGRAHV